MSDEVWGYSESEDSDSGWRGVCPTRESAIEEGARELGIEGAETFWIIRGSRPHPERFLPSVAHILEHMGELAGDECGEVADEFPDVDEVARESLRDLLVNWAKHHIDPCSFWIADGAPERVQRASAPEVQP